MSVQLEERLKDVFADVFETTVDKISPDMSTDTVTAWDSMQSIVLASSVESEFHVEFSDDELVRLDSFAKILAALQSHLAGERHV